jgi:DNA-binding MarR family transcriptional regulator
MGKAPPIIVAAVDGLEAKGLVARRRSSRDRRRSVVEVTDAGREMLARADVIAESVIADIFGALSAEERHALHDTLRRAMAVEPVAA